MPTEGSDGSEGCPSLIDMIPDAVMILRQGEITFANPIAARMFALARPEDLVGHHFLEVVDGDSADLVVRRLANPPPDDIISHYRLRRFDGDVFEAEIISRAIDHQGHPSRVLVVRDFAERSRIHEQMLQTNRLATLGELAAGLVHELSQPLNVIRMAAEGALMLIGQGKASPDWQTQQFALVAEQADRAAQIIDDIRIFSRRDRGPAQPFDAIAAIRAGAEMLRAQLAPDEIELILDLPIEPAMVLGRRIQLEQVVMNLITNAHHALCDDMTPKPADRVGRVAVSAVIGPARMRITIEDNGPGIPAELRARIFEPFYTTKMPGRGTGLGLSVSFGLIASMNGSLTVEDCPHGALFVISLPLDADEVASPPPPPAGFADVHVLLADDQTDDALAEALRGLGCRVSTACDGTAAWVLFQNDPADVVITDPMMPTRDGEALINRLRDFDPWLPIVIATGQPGSVAGIAGRLGDERCVVRAKPLDRRGLAEMIGAFLTPP
jgi:PAS domain S-box-containing protein